MAIYVFGNPELEVDSLPIRILPQLKEKFSEINFEIKDPNEDWDIPDELVIIDTVIGLKKPAVFDNLNDFQPAPNLTLHDFDAYSKLKFLQKLGKLKKVKILGLPPEFSENQALDFVSKNIK